MPVSGLVLTLIGDPDTQAVAIADLASDERLAIGPHKDGRVAVTASSGTDAEHRALVRHVCGHAGVMHVDVVFISTHPADNHRNQPS